MDYDLAKEQAKLSLAIQEGRRELNALKAEKEIFLSEREAEATARIVKALESAKQAVEDTNEYVSVVEKMTKEASLIVAELRAAKELMQTERREFQKRAEEARTILDAKAQELDSLSAKMRLEKMQLQGVVDQLQNERAMLAVEQKKIDDDRVKLKAAFKVWQRQNET